MIIPHCMIIKNQDNYTRDEVLSAAKILTGTAFKMYYYFTSAPTNHLLYERADFIKDCGSSINSVNRAFEELINFGFLKTEDEKNFIFLTSPEKNGIVDD